MSPPSAPARWAAPGDWPLVRSHITRLYVDEGRKLEDVMAIMASEYGHRGTLKMYKARIAKWGLRKYKKEDDMLFILNKMHERGDVGKETKFLVRGREITLEEVYKYFMKKGGLPPRTTGDTPLPSTPEHISYSTASPQSPDFVTVAASIYSQKKGRNMFDSSDARSGYSRTQSHPEGYSLSYVKAEDVSRMFFASSPGLSAPISAPQTLLISEELLFNVKSYFYGSFQSGTWIASGVEDCINTNDKESNLDDLANFVSCCFSAARSIESKSYVDARIMLSTACKLIKGILRRENPRSLDIMLEGLLYLKKYHQLDQVVDIMRKYIGAMAMIVFANTPVHPWRKIWGLISIVEAGQFEATIEQSWRCASDALQENLGMFHTSALVCYLEYIRWGSTTYYDEELALRQLLSECQQLPNNYTPLVNILYSLTANLDRQNRYVEAEVQASQLLALALEKDSVDEMLWGLTSLFLAQKHQNKREEAILNIRKTIALASKKGGPSSPEAILHWAALERWLREWGEDEKADEVRKEFEPFLKQHDVAEDDPGVFQPGVL